MKIGDLKVKVNVKLSFWSALKLRLSGIRSFEEKVGQISRKYTFSKNGLIVTEYYLNKKKKSWHVYDENHEIVKREID